MAAHTLVDSDAAAVELASMLNGATRTRPTAVITIAAGQPEPYIDVDEVARELEGLVDVYLMATGPHTWTFSNAMREGTQVYGGAGRVDPLGHDWVEDLSRSPLRFAWGRAEGRKTTQRLIDDGLDMAAAAGLLGSRASSPTLVPREGVVRRADDERAWVAFGGGGLDMGVVPPQLAEPDLPIERVLQPGMSVSGVFDVETRWFDIRESRLEPATALAPYEIGDVVLAEVVEVSQDYARARLHPSVTVKLGRADVTPDSSDLRALLSRGEVLVARVLGTSPWWLTLLEVDEEPVPAVSLYPGGPSWLLPPVETEPIFEPVAEPDAVTAPAPATPIADPATASSPADVAYQPPPLGPPPPAPRPDPAPASSSGSALQGLSLKVTELQARSRALETELANLRDEVAAMRYERDQLESLKRAAESRANRFESELKKSRKALRQATSGQPSAPPVFADRERGFRHLVDAAWARRIPPAEQPARALPDYLVADAFLDSLETLEGISTEKVADVVMELLTGIAETSPGRDLHRLRTGAGGDNPVRQRQDGAVCWRLALQVNTPSARRLHAWRLADGRWELSSVRKHDDFEA
jgi:hypothetical protein